MNKYLVVYFATIVSLISATCDPNAPRSFDGSCNNLQKPQQGVGNSIYIAPEGFEYADDYTEPMPQPKSSREISNLFFPDDDCGEYDCLNPVSIPLEGRRYGNNPDPKGLNMLSVLFGQFVAHDITSIQSSFNITKMMTNPPIDTTIQDPLDKLWKKTIIFLPTQTFYYFPASSTVEDLGGGMTRLTSNELYVQVVHTNGSYTYHPAPYTATGMLYKNKNGLAIQPGHKKPNADNTKEVSINLQTSYIDLSHVYGPTVEISNLLRAHDGSGKLKAGPRGELPSANQTGYWDSVCTLEGDNKFSVGDPRVGDNIVLTALHTLYLKNHNRICDWLAVHRPDLTTDEARYQRARDLNIATFQQQVYNEYLPTTFGFFRTLLNLGIYTGYKSNVDTTVSTAFSIAAFRIGHDQVNSPTMVPTDECEQYEFPVIPGQPHYERPNCVFNDFMSNKTSITNVFKGAIDQVAQKTDSKVTTILRNILFGGFSPFNMDVEAETIFRNREAGVANYNKLREHYLGQSLYNLPGCHANHPNPDPLACFKYITRENTYSALMRDVYKNVDKVEPYVGLFHEHDPLLAPDSTGPTLTKIIMEQFKRLRDGDRLFYLNLQNNLNFRLSEWLLISESVGNLLKENFDLDIYEAFKASNTNQGFCV